MNVSTFKYILTVLLLAGLSFTSSAQKMRFLIPDGVVLQYAGSIGYFSGGIDYDLFRNKRGSLDILYGFVPKSKGGAFSTLSTKFAYRPFEIKVSPWLIIHPVNPGLFLSYTLDKNFDLIRDRDQYIKGYYSLPEALRTHVSLSSEFTIDTAVLGKSKKLRTVTIYYEVNTNDIYLVNYFQNTRGLSLGDVFKAGLGIKASF
jgi:hypothetical protein